MPICRRQFHIRSHPRPALIILIFRCLRLMPEGASPEVARRARVADCALFLAIGHDAVAGMPWSRRGERAR